MPSIPPHSSRSNKKDTCKGSSKPLKQDNQLCHSVFKRRNFLRKFEAFSPTIGVTHQQLSYKRGVLGDQERCTQCRTQTRARKGESNNLMEERSAVPPTQSKSSEILMSCNRRRKISITTRKLAAILSDAISSGTQSILLCKPPYRKY